MWKRKKTVFENLDATQKTMHSTVQLLAHRRVGSGIRWSVCESALNPTKQQQHLQHLLAPCAAVLDENSFHKRWKATKVDAVQKGERIWCQSVDDSRSAAAGDLTWALVIIPALSLAYLCNLGLYKALWNAICTNRHGLSYIHPSG